jgi:hypothetical protein
MHMPDKRYVTIDAVHDLPDWHRDKKCQDQTQVHNKQRTHQ